MCTALHNFVKFALLMVMGQAHYYTCNVKFLIGIESSKTKK